MTKTMIGFGGFMLWIALISYFHSNEGRLQLDEWLFSLEVDTCPLRIPGATLATPGALNAFWVNEIALKPFRGMLWFFILSHSDIDIHFDDPGLRALRMKYEEDFPCIKGKRNIPVLLQNEKVE